MEKKVINVLKYYEILVVDTEYPHFSPFCYNTSFHCCRPVNIAKYLRTLLLKKICERLLLMKRSSLLHHKKEEI